MHRYTMYLSLQLLGSGMKLLTKTCNPRVSENAAGDAALQWMHGTSPTPPKSGSAIRMEAFVSHGNEREALKPRNRQKGGQIPR
jgi:hypothetical protein